MLDIKGSNNSDFFTNFLSTRLIWILFSVSMLLTIAVSYRFHVENQTVSLEHFNDASKQTATMISETMRDHQEIINSGIAYYNASEMVTNDEWNTFSAQILSVQAYPAIKRIKLLRPDAPDTAIALSDASMKESMTRSLQTGKVAMTTSTDGAVTYITLPLYQKDHTHVGWIMGIINTHELFSPLHGDLTRNLDFTLSDKHNTPIFSTLTKQNVPTKHQRSDAMTLMGKNLILKTYSTPSSLAKIHSDVSMYILIGGTILNLFLLLALAFFKKKKQLIEIKNNELEMLYALINESNDMVFILRVKDGYIEYANDTSIKLLGYSMEEMRSIGIGGFRRPINKDEPFLDHLQELKLSKRLTDYAMLIRKDGSEFPIEANARLVHYNNTDYNIAIVRDITENENYTQKIAAVNNRLNEAQKLAKLGSWYLNLSTYVLEWSDEIYEIFEINKEEHDPTYEGFLNAIHPEDRELVDSVYTNSVEQHIGYNYVHRLLMKDERIKYVREQGETFYDANGVPTESRGTVHDITEEILLQKSLTFKNHELMEASARLDLATHAAGIGIWVWDLTDDTLLWDTQMYTLYDVENYQSEMKQPYAFWKSYCHPDDLDAMETALHSTIDTGIPMDTSFRIHDSKGNVRHLQATAMIKYDENNVPQYMIGINRDITMEKNLTQSLTISKEAAEKANQIKSDFLANMSHEIRTPLNGVIGLTEMLLQTELNPLQHEYLIKSEVASRALLNVLNNVLDYSKIEAEKLILEVTTFNLDEVMANLIAMLSYKAERKQLSLETHIDDNVPRVLAGDPLRLQQILSNLTVNALKFTESGYVRISVTATTHEGRDKFTFSISDSGIGMNPQEQTALFQPFSQVDTSFTRKYGGSGLGLMITKELVDLMGGEITVHSVSGEGSTFTFTALFDRVTLEQSIEKKTHTDLFALPNHKPIHLLLVEDNDLNQLVAQERLKQMGITCSIANNGLEAVEMVQKETFDAILMDMQMPVMDGLTATREIRKLAGFANLPIIALSAAVMKDDLAQAQEAGMNDFVAKPIDKITLQNVLSKWLSV